MIGFQPKTGSYQLHSHPNFNFQMNRLIMWNAGEYEEVKEAAPRIYDCKSWSREIAALGDKALEQGRSLAASGYYRMSEFFLFDGDPEKLPRYRKAKALFYEAVEEWFASGLVQRHAIAFGGHTLPVLSASPLPAGSGGLDLPAELQGFGRTGAAVSRGTVLLHGGYDSYMEELFFGMLYFAGQGFDTYLFEGPGQGGVLREQNVPFTHRWEEPVKAVCDALKLQNVTLIGASLGGMLAPRAAAFEKRVRRVVGWAILPEFQQVILDMLPAAGKAAVKLLLKAGAKEIVNAAVRVRMKKDDCIEWGVLHGMYAMGADSPYTYLRRLADFKMTDVGGRIDQDVLILGAYQDHFIDWHHYREELDALPHAASLTLRLFSEKDSAAAHCNVGNTMLVLETIADWIRSVPARSGIQDTAARDSR